MDAPFTEVGDDVTLDYDGQVRCHSFEDFRLKFTTFKIGHGVTIMTGASVAMCDAGDGAPGQPDLERKQPGAGRRLRGRPGGSGPGARSNALEESTDGGEGNACRPECKVNALDALDVKAHVQQCDSLSGRS